MNSNSTAKRIRVEVIIPSRYRNGKLIEISKHKETKDEIIERFGQGTFLTTSEGDWKNHGDKDREYSDINTSFFVVADDTQETIDFFKNYRNVLEKSTTNEIYTSTTILLPNCDDTPNQYYVSKQKYA